MLSEKEKKLRGIMHNFLRGRGGGTSEYLGCHNKNLGSSISDNFEIFLSKDLIASTIYASIVDFDATRKIIVHDVIRLLEVAGLQPASTRSSYEIIQLFFPRIVRKWKEVDRSKRTYAYICICTANRERY